MKSAKQFLQQIDSVKFESVINQLKVKLVEAKTDEEIHAILESSDVESYKRKALVEYLDKNKDKLLAMSVYNEGDPVQVGDDYAPLARKHGKIVSKGAAAGSYKVRFEDGEYDVPEHHITRRDAVATESAEDHAKPGHSGEKKKIYKAITEHRCLALLEDHTIVKVVLESLVNADKAIEEQLGQRVVVVFPESISESFVASLTEEEMTDAQKAKREEIVFGLKKNKKDLQKRYGDRWESVMYAIATKRAMEESLAEASEDVVFKQKVDGHTVLIVKDGEYFRMKRLDGEGNVVDVQEFDNITDAENAAMSHL